MSEPASAAASFVLSGGIPLVLARATYVAASLSGGGVLVFRVLVLSRVRPRVAPETLRAADRALGRLTASSLGIAVAALACWTWLQTAELAGATQPETIVSALGPVLRATRFGHLVLLQAAALVVAAALLRASLMPASATVAIANVGLQAGHGHAMAMVGVLGPLFWVDVTHLLAGSAWVGGLLPLLIVVRLAPARTAALAARWFSPLGIWCVVLLAASALIEGWRLVGSLAALFETPYGWMVLLKSALAGARAAPARRALAVSIAVQTAAGGLAILAAGVLSGLTPGMDMRFGA